VKPPHLPIPAVEDQRTTLDLKVAVIVRELAFTSKEHAFSKKSMMDLVLLTSTVSGSCSRSIMTYVIFNLYVCRPQVAECKKLRAKNAVIRQHELP
jgi:hypothetical protein